MKSTLFYIRLMGLLVLCLLPLLLISCADKSCDHTILSETVIAPTCDKEGRTVHQCADCPFVYITDRVAPLGHTLKTAVTEPTCATEGYTSYTCHCGYAFEADRVPPTGHSYQRTVTLPTCEKEGYTDFTCACGVQYRGSIVSPLGHVYNKKETPPTCTEAGYTDYTCTCGDSYRSDLIVPKGHAFTEAVTLPTVLSMGYTDYTCPCGFSYVGDFRSYRDILENAYAENDRVLSRGIDVSKWNHKVDAHGNYLPLDWAAIKAAGVDYVILKAGSTRSGLEPTFEMDYAGAKAAGLHVGVYFYTYSATVEATRADARRLIGWLAGKQLEYPVYFDLEDPSLKDLLPSHLTELCLTFCATLQTEGYYAGVYTNLDWLQNRLETTRMLSLFEIWYAHWTYSELPVWSETTDLENLGMWQYTDRGSFDFLPGVAFDRNYAYKDYPALMASLGLNGF